MSLYTADQAYMDAEAVLHACERLQVHLKAQDLAIRHIVDHMNECRRVAAVMRRPIRAPGADRAAM